MNFIKKLLGFEKIEANIATANKLLEEATAKKDEAEQALKVVQEQEELAKLTPKERATRKNDPWVGVLNTHVNKDNVRNGFFELDWNEPFVLKLKQEGYGFDGDKDEEIVDRWFRELCANVVVDGDFGGPINTGVIDINEVKRKNQTQ
jgi:hypothetical protein